MYLNMRHLLFINEIVGSRLPAASAATFTSVTTASGTSPTSSAFPWRHRASLIHRERSTFKICAVEFRNRVRCFLVR